MAPLIQSFRNQLRRFTASASDHRHIVHGHSDAKQRLDNRVNVCQERSVRLRCMQRSKRSFMVECQQVGLERHKLTISIDHLRDIFDRVSMPLYLGNSRQDLTTTTRLQRTLRQAFEQRPRDARGEIHVRDIIQAVPAVLGDQVNVFLGRANEIHHRNIGHAISLGCNEPANNND